MAIFISKQKKFEVDLKIELCSKRLYPIESIKYLGVKIDPNLNWECHVNNLSIKLNKTRIINFEPRNSHTTPFFKQRSILKSDGKFA